MLKQDTPFAYPPTWVAWTTVAILTATYMFSFLDRLILTLLIEPIKADLGISDTQVSLLTGAAFAVTYTVMSIPLARLADQRGRKYIIVAGVSVWSLMTIFSGYTRNFWQLFVARMGVGVGEAGLTAPAYAMISDLFPARRIGLALSVFAMGATPAFLLGGGVLFLSDHLQTLSIPFLDDVPSWRLALIVAGALSLMMVIPLAWMPEPKRQPVRHNTPDDLHSRMPFKAVVQYMVRHKAFYGFFIAAIFAHNLFGIGYISWLPTYFVRVREWDAAFFGTAVGTLTLVPSILGGVFAGWLSDKLFSGGRTAAPLLIMIAIHPILLLLIAFVIYAQTSFHQLTALFVAAPLYTMTGALFPVVIQMATPPAIRSQVSAIILFFTNLAGLGLGATTVALVTDYVFRDEMALGHSLIVVGTIAYLLTVVLLFFTLKPFARQVKTVVGESEAPIPDTAVLMPMTGPAGK